MYLSRRQQRAAALQEPGASVAAGTPSCGHHHSSQVSQGLSNKGQKSAMGPSKIIRLLCPCFPRCDWLGGFSRCPALTAGLLGEQLGGVLRAELTPLTHCSCPSNLGEERPPATAVVCSAAVLSPASRGSSRYRPTKYLSDHQERLLGTEKIW